MKRVAGYARVSTAMQVNDGTSLEAQRNKIEKTCKNLGYELVGFYSDDGISGGSLNRPKLKELLRDAKDGKFDAVLRVIVNSW